MTQPHDAQEALSSRLCRLPFERIHALKGAPNALTLNWARVDQIYPYPPRTELMGYRLTQRIEGSLWHHIRDAPVVVGTRKDRGDVDDRTARWNVWRHGTHEVPGDTKHAGNSTCQRFILECIRAYGELDEGLTWTITTRVVHEQIDPSKTVHHSCHTQAYRVTITTIHHQRRDTILCDALLLDEEFTERLEPSTIPTTHHYCSALSEEAAGEYLTNPSGSTGDQRDLTTQSTSSRR